MTHVRGLTNSVACIVRWTSQRLIGGNQALLPLSGVSLALGEMTQTATARKLCPLHALALDEDLSIVCMVALVAVLQLVSFSLGAIGQMTVWRHIESDHSDKKNVARCLV